MASDNGRVESERRTEEVEDPDKSRFVGDNGQAARGKTSNGSSGEESSQGAGGVQASAELEQVKGYVQWWRGWWWQRMGYAGVLVPAALAVVYWFLLGAPAILLGLGLGIATSLLWSAGTKAAKIGAAAIAAIPLYPLILLAAPWLITVGIVLVGAWLIAKNQSSKPKPTGPYKARWAEPDETEDMRMSLQGDDEEGGIVLGEKDGELIGVYPGFEGRKEMGHILVVGPSRSGKSLNLETNLLRWRGSVIVNDIKGSIYGNTASWREEHFGSKTKALDPSGRGSRYDPFAELSYRPEGLRSAAELIMAPHEDRQPIFGQRGIAGLYAAALAARIEGAPTLPYVRELTEEGPKEFVEKLNSLGDREVRRSLIEFLGGKPEDLPDDHYHADKFFTSTWSNMTTKLQPFFSAGVLKMCGGSDFEAADLVREPTTLYLMFSESELRYTKKVYQVMVMALITGLIRYGDINPDIEEENPLLLALDEAGRTPIPELDDMVSTISGRGMSALIYVQSLNQLNSAYDEDRAGTIRENCHTKVFYKPEDQDTAEYISRMSGQTSVVDVTLSKSTKPHNPVAFIPSPVNESRSWRERELITEDEARQVSQETVFIFTGRKPPILARRLKWFELIPEAIEFAREHPPAEPEELPMPERRWADVDGHGETGAREEPKSETSPDGSGERERRSAQQGEGGYIEPDV